MSPPPQHAPAAAHELVAEAGQGGSSGTTNDNGDKTSADCHTSNGAAGGDAGDDEDTHIYIPDAGRWTTLAILSSLNMLSDLIGKWVSVSQT